MYACMYVCLLCRNMNTCVCEDVCLRACLLLPALPSSVERRDILSFHLRSLVPPPHGKDEPEELLWIVSEPQA